MQLIANTTPRRHSGRDQIRARSTPRPTRTHSTRRTSAPNHTPSFDNKAAAEPSVKQQVQQTRSGAAVDMLTAVQSTPKLVEHSKQAQPSIKAESSTSKNIETVDKQADNPHRLLNSYSSVADLDQQLTVSKPIINRQLIINVVAVICLIYGIVNIYLINQRSKVAYDQRQTAVAVAEQVAVNTSASTQIKQGTGPTVINIKKIGVKAPIDEMGVTADNRIEAPENLAHAGWYNGSATMDSDGVTIIDGHLGSNIEPGVFRNLETLEAGDIIELQSEDGSSQNYAVRKTIIMNKDSKEFEKIYDAVGDNKGLNIITCSGGWLPSQQTYDSRLIVYAEQVFA